MIIFQNFQNNLQKRKKKLKKFIYILKNPRNLFKIKKDMSSDYLWDHYFFSEIVNNSSALLSCKIYEAFQPKLT